MYLPVKDVADATINGIGYNGWVSFQLFSRAMERKDHAVIEELALRCAIGRGKKVVDLGLEIEKFEHPPPFKKKTR